jgi:hypothetical protein
VRQIGLPWQSGQKSKRPDPARSRRLYCCGVFPSTSLGASFAGTPNRYEPDDSIILDGLFKPDARLIFRKAPYMANIKSPHIHKNFRVCESIATQAKPSEAQLAARDLAYVERALLSDGEIHLGSPPKSRSALHMPPRPRPRRTIDIDLPAILRAPETWLARRAAI